MTSISMKRLVIGGIFESLYHRTMEVRRITPYNRGMRRCLLFYLLFFLVWGSIPAHGQGGAPAFDLIGPKVDVHVKRGDVTLPIGQVPNLLPGDRLWLHPDFPESQSTRFVLIVAFLRAPRILLHPSGLRALIPGINMHAKKASS